MFGVGINDYEGSTRVDGKKIKSYKTWTSMLERCYSDKLQARHPTYIGCSVSPEWLSFNNFKEWYDTNYNHELNAIHKLQLDKDLLISNNKVYSKDTCLFLPQRVNLFLANNYSNNTSGFTGVSWHKHANKWHVQIKSNGVNKYIGLYTDINLANQAYVQARSLECANIKQFMLELGYAQDIIDKIY